MLIERFEIIDWNYPKVIITDRNRKFLFKLWNAIFAKLKFYLLYSISYHSQTNNSSEQTNQTTKIALRSYIHDLKNLTIWFQCLSTFETLINNFTFVAIEKAFNEIVYDFISNTFTNLFRQEINIINFFDLLKSCIEIKNVVF